MPSRVSGTLTTMCASIFAMSCPCCSMPAKSVAVTSPLTGPLTISQMRFRFCRKSPGSFASSDGFVVTPSRMPSAAIASMSLMLPVSTKSFMGAPFAARILRSPCGFFDARRQRAEVAGRVHGPHGVGETHARRRAILKRRFLDRFGDDRHQRLRGDRSPEHDVAANVALGVRVPDQVDRGLRSAPPAAPAARPARTCRSASRTPAPTRCLRGWRRRS